MTPEYKILVIEDDIKFAKLLNGYLSSSGLTVTVLNSSEGALQQVRMTPPHLVLLDIMLPGKDGVTLFKEIKAISDIPIVFITAKVDETDRLAGFDLGADDYLCKPFALREVVARVKSILRRVYSKTTEKELAAGSIEMDTSQHKFKIRGAEVHLTPIQWGLMECFLSQPDCVLTRNDLITMIQGYNFEGYDRTINNHIKNLRKLLQQYFPEQKIFRSVYGVGYAFIVPDDRI